VELCELMADCGFPLSQDLLHHITQDVLNERNNNNNGVKEIHEIGQKWVERFLTRHPSINKRYITYQERVRKQGAMEEIRNFSETWPTLHDVRRLHQIIYGIVMRKVYYG